MHRLSKHTYHIILYNKHVDNRSFSPCHKQPLSDFMLYTAQILFHYRRDTRPESIRPGSDKNGDM